MIFNIRVSDAYCNMAAGSHTSNAPQNNMTIISVYISICMYILYLLLGIWGGQVRVSLFARTRIGWRPRDIYQHFASVEIQLMLRIP